MQNDDLDADLFGGPVRAYVLRELARNGPVRYAQVVKPITSAAFYPAFHGLAQAGVVMQDEHGNYRLDEGFTGTRALRDLLGATIPEGSATERPAMHGLLRPTLFGRPSRTCILLAMPHEGSVSASDLAKRAGVPLPKLRRIAARLRKSGILAAGEPVQFNPDFPRIRKVIALLAACAPRAEAVPANPVSTQLAALFRSASMARAFQIVASQGRATVADLAAGGIVSDAHGVAAKMSETGAVQRFLVGNRATFQLNADMKGLREFRALLGLDEGADLGGNVLTRPFGTVPTALLCLLAEDEAYEADILEALDASRHVILSALTRLCNASIVEKIGDPKIPKYRLPRNTEAEPLRAFLRALNAR